MHTASGTKQCYNGTLQWCDVIHTTVGALHARGHASPDLIPSIPSRVNCDLRNEWPAPHRLSHDATQADPVGYAILLIPPSPCSKQVSDRPSEVCRNTCPMLVLARITGRHVLSRKRCTLLPSHPACACRCTECVQNHASLLLLPYQPQSGQVD